MTRSPLDYLARAFAAERDEIAIEDALGEVTLPSNDVDPQPRMEDYDYARSALLALIGIGALTEEWSARVRADLGLDHLPLR